MDKQPTKERFHEGRRQWFRTLAAAAAGSTAAAVMPAEGGYQTADLPPAARRQILPEHQQKYYRTARML
jgi:hypothetical protein